MADTVIGVVGPTGVGKTALSIEIARRFNGEIISGDSMQVYKGLDIGTSKITNKETQGIPHHMIDIKYPAESFSVAEFQEWVQFYIRDISDRGKIPIIVGGTGLYIQSALYNYQFSEQPRSEKVTQKLQQELKNKGSDNLYNRLKEIDPVQASKTHPNNHRRLIRALEVYEATGKTMTEYQEEQPKTSPYNYILIGLEMGREQLYNRINKRVDEMLERGLVQEVKQLYDQGYENYQSMRGIGYKELIPYLKGEQTFDEAINILKRNSRRYAKRQYTWFKNKLKVFWYPVTPDTMNNTYERILTDLAGLLSKI